MNQVPSITTILANIQNWMHYNVPDVSFRPPATSAAIDSFAHKSGLAIPESLRKTLLVMNGENPTSAGMIGNWRLMPITEIQAAWGLLQKISEKGAFYNRVSEPSPYIRRAWWYSAWIPIVTSDTGDYFCLDTDPPDPARTGQVILFLQNRPERPLIAASLQSWFDRILSDLGKGLYHYDPEAGFDGEAFLWSALEGKHLFDGNPGKLMVED